MRDEQTEKDPCKNTVDHRDNPSQGKEALPLSCSSEEASSIVVGRKDKILLHLWGKFNIEVANSADAAHTDGILDGRLQHAIKGEESKKKEGGKQDQGEHEW